MRVFDELSTNETNISIEQYFDEMELSKKEKEKRKAFSRDFLEIMLFIFSLFSVMNKYGYINKKYIISQLQIKYSEIVLQYMDIDKYIDDYIKEFSEETVETTIKNIDDEFYLSEDRSLLISINEANTTLNYKEFADAIKLGKKRKQWRTEKDDLVRKTHKVLDNVIIPIEDTFVVGNTLMRFPHDTMYGIDYKELSNCRCTIKYF